MKIYKDVLLKEYTTFKIGGRSSYFADCSSLNNLKKALKFANDKKIEFFVLGKGSNIIFSDEGFNGLVVFNNINFLKINQTELHVGAGFDFMKLGLITAELDLGGLEFAAGVPGSLGGAVFMNASAFAQQVSDFMTEVEYLTENGEKLILKKEDCKFSYRNSFFQETKGVIVSAKFKLIKNKNAKEKQNELVSIKRKNQPMNEKNAGCIFKNPINHKAKDLISECGLKNFQFGGAKISDLHANFIINESDATAKDVLDLIEHIKKIVFEKKNIELEQEVKVIYSKVRNEF